MTINSVKQFWCLHVRIYYASLKRDLYTVASVTMQAPAPATKGVTLQQSDASALCGAETPSPFTVSPTPRFRAGRWTASHPTGQPFSLWKQDFITEKNCLIVRTQLPPLTGEGGALQHGHWCIMGWPGFRGQFTHYSLAHCLESISRNASQGGRPLFSAQAPLTATPSTRALIIIVQAISYNAEVTTVPSPLSWMMEKYKLYIFRMSTYWGPGQDFHTFDLIYI